MAGWEVGWCGGWWSGVQFGRAEVEREMSKAEVRGKAERKLCLFLAR